MSDGPKFKTFRDLKSIPTNNSFQPTTSTSSNTSISSTPSNTSISSTPRINKNKRSAPQTKQEISPIRDFQKVPNSVTRAAMAQGLFRGKSKQVWDYLWSVSRGAINPTRVVRRSRKEIKEGSGLGSMVTVDAAIEHLVQSGLLNVSRSVGSLNGNEYEIFTPEEAQTYTSTSSIASNTSPIQNLVHLDIPESGNTSRTQVIENTSGSNDAKTSFKTLKYIDDDAPIINLLEKFNGMARKLTGKDLTKKDLEKLSDVAEMLINETVIAAARTGAVSSSISFMAENLRRRLYSKARPASKKDARPAHLDVGKSKALNEVSNSYAMPEALDDDVRQKVLSALLEAKASDSIFFREFKTYGEIEYTPEDFKWLMENLEKGIDDK